MLVGLQGSGKTTAAGKLARLLRSQGERVMLVACDPYRPAAVKQLETLGENINVPVEFEPGVSPPELASHALEKPERWLHFSNPGYRRSVAARSRADE
jgi:signal recognition particle subunit SRP54